MSFELERGDALSPISIFLMRKTEPAPNVLTTRQELYAAYVAWVNEENEKAAALDALHADDGDWLTGDPTTPLRAAVFFATLPTAVASVIPSAFASRVMVNGRPSGQRGFKGLKLREPLNTDMRVMDDKPSIPVEVGGPPRTSPGLEFAKAAFLAGYEAGWAEAQDREDGVFVPYAAWDEWLNTSLDPFAATLRRAGEAVAKPELDTDGY